MGCCLEAGGVISCSHELVLVVSWGGHSSVLPGVVGAAIKLEVCRSRVIVAELIDVGTAAAAAALVVTDGTTCTKLFAVCFGDIGWCVVVQLGLGRLMKRCSR